MAAGATYHVWGSLDGPADEMLMGRLVCDWSVQPEAVSAFLAAVQAAG